MSKYKPAIFQPTVRPSWSGTLSYISVEEKSQILEAIIGYPKNTNIHSKFWEETIKPDLDNQYECFLNTCIARGRGAKTYWETKGKDKLSLCLSNDKDEVNSLKDKDKNQNKDKNQDKENLVRYGEFGNVCLSEEYYTKLQSEHSQEEINYAVEKLDAWLDNPKQKNKLNKNHRGYFKKDSWVWEGFGGGYTRQFEGWENF